MYHFKRVVFALLLTTYIAIIKYSGGTQSVYRSLTALGSSHTFKTFGFKRSVDSFHVRKSVGMTINITYISGNYFTTLYYFQGTLGQCLACKLVQAASLRCVCFVLILW